MPPFPPLQTVLRGGHADNCPCGWCLTRKINLGKKRAAAVRPVLTGAEWDWQAFKKLFHTGPPVYAH